MPSRRAVLGAGVTLGCTVAGCVSVSINGEEPGDGWASLELRPVADDELGRSIESEFEVPGELADDVLAADEAFTTAPAAIPDGGSVRGSDGSYYELAVEPTDRYWSEYAIGFVATESAAASDPAPIDDLRPIDRVPVEAALPPTEESGSEFGDGTDVDAATTEVYGRSGRERSALLDGSVETVVYEGVTYDVSVERRAVLPGVATVTTARVANDDAEYGQQVRAEAAAELTGLSDAEREVVEEAIDDEYRIESPDGAFASVVRRLRETGTVHDAIETWVVLYDGRTFLGELTEHGLAVEAGR